MALVKDDLTAAMINATKSCPDGGEAAMIALGRAIENYLISNTDAVYSWSGVDPLAVPDPETSFKAVLSASGTDFTSVPPDFKTWIADLAEFLNGIKINAAAGWSLGSLATGSGTFTAEQLGTLADETDCDGAMNDAFGIIAAGIIDGWVSYFVPSASGSHAAFSGSAALVSVS